MVSFTKAAITVGGDIPTLVNIDALRNYTPRGLRDGAAALVTGNVETGDAKGGIFVWSDGDQRADDGLDVVKPIAAVDTGRWLRAIGQQGSPGPKGEGLEAVQAVNGAALVGYRAANSALVETLKDFADHSDSLYAASFGVRVNVMVDQAPAINAAIIAAAAQGKNVVLPASTENPGQFIYIGSPIIILPYVGITGHGLNQTRLKMMDGYTGGMFKLPAGPVTFGFFSDFGCYGNNAAGEHCFNFESQPALDGYPHGGLWSWTFRRIRCENFGGITLKLWGGSNSALVHQFITVQDCTFYRANRATSRCVSLAGQVGQIYFVGNNEFDGLAGGLTEGTNIVVSKLYQNGSLTGDIVDAANEDGSSKAGWSTVPGDNNFSYAIYFIGTTTQWSYRGVIVDQCYGFTFDGYVEGTAQAFTIVSGTTASIKGQRFGNASGFPPAGEIPGYTGRTADGTGYLVLNDNSHVSILDGTDIGGRCERSFIRRGGVIPTWSIGSVRMPGETDATTIPSDFTAALTVNGSGILELKRVLDGYTGNGSGVTQNINGVLGWHAPGAIVTVTCAFNSVLQFNNADSPARAGIAPILRWKDSLTLRLKDEGTAWTIVGRSIAPLTATSMPTTGYYQAGEFVRNMSASSYTPASGKLHYGWVRVTSGNTHVAGTDWQTMFMTNS